MFHDNSEYSILSEYLFEEQKKNFPVIVINKGIKKLFSAHDRFYCTSVKDFIMKAIPLNVYDNTSEFPYIIYTINEPQFEEAIRTGELSSELIEQAEFKQKANYILIRKGIYAFKLKESFIKKGQHCLRWFVINSE